MINRTTLALAAFLLVAAGPPQVVPPSIAPSTLGQPSGPAQLGSDGASLNGPDGTASIRLGSLPASASPAEFLGAVPAVTSGGGTLLCQRATPTAAAVRCNLVAQGNGAIWLGNGSGILMQLLDPGATISNNLTITPGTVASPGVRVATTALGQLALTAGTSATPSGLSFGFNSSATGANCFASGNFALCQAASNIVTGSTAYDYAQAGTFRIHSSGQVLGGSSGSNEVWEQTLQATITGASAARMTTNGVAISFAAMSVPVQSTGHGTATLEVECSKSTGDQAAWTVRTAYTRWGTALTLTGKTGDGSPTMSTSALSTMALSVTADTTYSNLNISVTPPSGNSATIGCTAYVRWQQRLA